MSFTTWALKQKDTGRWYTGIGSHKLNAGAFSEHKDGRFEWCERDQAVRARGMTTGTVLVRIRRSCTHSHWIDALDLRSLALTFDEAVFATREAKQLRDACVTSMFRQARKLLRSKA